MICYFGIRPTSSNLHLGHVMTLFNMFDFIKKNRNKVSKIYFLMAEIHAEISTIDTMTIRDNSYDLMLHIIPLFKAYFSSFDDISNDEIETLVNKIKFILQGEDCIMSCHQNVTYKYLSIVQTNYLTRNPIYLNSVNKSIAFLIYPILQAFDVLLYHDPTEEMVVFVGNDQKANINIIKDVISKLKFDGRKLNFNIYDCVLYDNKGENKMSKSLNNFVNFQDFEGISEYVTKFKTFPRQTIDTIGNHKECPMYKFIGNELQRFFSESSFVFDRCDTGKVGCGVCKNTVKEILKKINTKYNFFYNRNDLQSIIDFNTTNVLSIEQNYTELLTLIDMSRSST